MLPRITFQVFSFAPEPANEHKGTSAMAQEFKFSVDQARVIAKLINNFCIAGSQIMQMDQPNIWHKSCANLREFQKQHQVLFQILDKIGESINEEKTSLLIESLDKRPNDAAGILSLSRRCLNASAFLAHCLAVVETTHEDSRLREHLSEASSVH